MVVTYGYYIEATVLWKIKSTIFFFFTKIDQASGMWQDKHLPCLTCGWLSPKLGVPTSTFLPKLPLTTPSVWSRVCSDSICGELPWRAGGFARAAGPGGGQRQSPGRGGAGTQTASVGPGGWEQWPVQTPLLSNKQPRAEGEQLIFVLVGADIDRSNET